LKPIPPVPANNERGTTVIALIAIAVALLVLITALGMPYSQSWYGRWGDSDR